MNTPLKLPTLSGDQFGVPFESVNDVCAPAGATVTQRASSPIGTSIVLSFVREVDTDARRGML
ncbi:MAG: hypothetical protein ACLPYS_06215 [Vulcanimicrobiaceae bacterium]